MGTVWISRGNKKSIRAMFTECASILTDDVNGVPILIYPQGTRSKIGEFKPFKDGAFIMSKQHGIDICPISLHLGEYCQQIC